MKRYLKSNCIYTTDYINQTNVAFEAIIEIFSQKYSFLILQVKCIFLDIN